MKLNKNIIKCLFMGLAADRPYAKTLYVNNDTAFITNGHAALIQGIPEVKEDLQAIPFKDVKSAESPFNKYENISKGFFEQFKYMLDTYNYKFADFKKMDFEFLKEEFPNNHKYKLCSSSEVPCIDIKNKKLIWGKFKKKSIVANIYDFIEFLKLVKSTEVEYGYYNNCHFLRHGEYMLLSMRLD